MTDITVYTTQLQAENLAWDLSQPGVPYREGATIDVALPNAAQHYANGFIPSGTVLAVKTSTGFIGPYLDSLSNGQEVAVGLLSASVQVLAPNGIAKAKVGISVLKAFGVISVARLPFTSGTAALGGYLDANARADLSKLHFAA